jgi:hypothetical protein
LSEKSQVPKPASCSSSRQSHTQKQDPKIKMGTAISNPEAVPSEKVPASYTGSIEAKEVDMQLGEVSTAAPNSADSKRVLRRIDYW